MRVVTVGSMAVGVFSFAIVPGRGAIVANPLGAYPNPATNNYTSAGSGAGRGILRCDLDRQFIFVSSEEIPGHIWHEPCSDHPG